MADTNSTGSRKLPNFYSAVGQMEAYNPAGGGASKSPAQPGSAQGGAGEKVATATTLLEVVRKMDSMEQDPEAKKLLEQMVGIAEQYMEKVQGPGAKAAGAGTGSAPGQGPSPSSGAGAGAGAGAGMGAPGGGGAGEAVPPGM